MTEAEDPREILPIELPAEGSAVPDTEVEGTGEAEDGAPLKKEVSLEDQTSRLPPKELVLVTTSLLFAIFLSSFEQNSVSTTLPGIARDFGTSTAISWVGTAFLVTCTSSQIIYSRLSDIFGRKILLIITIAIFSLGNLLCGFAKNLAQLIIFRAIAGYGGGGIQCLVLIIMSDIVSLKERGKYQAYVGVGVAMGGAAGPLLGGVFTQQVTWRWVFWITVPLSVSSLLLIIFFLPLKPVTGSFKKKLRKVDFLGAFTSLIATVFILVPISGGGSSFAWSSPIVVAMLTIGIASFLIFLFVEWKIAPLPIMPLRLFHNRSLFLLAWISFLSGVYFFGNTYFLPIYFQLALDPPAGPLLSSALQQALLLPQISTALSSGFALQKLGHYNPILWSGYGFYLIGAGIQTTFGRSTSHAYIAGILILEGFGIGWTLQTALVAAQALAPAKDRAVITGIRNLFRFTGGSFGLVISSAIMNNVIASKLTNSDLPQDIVSQIRGAEFNIPAGLTEPQQQTLLDFEMDGIKGVFYFLLGTAALTLLLSLPVKDGGLPGDEKKKTEEDRNNGEIEKSTGDLEAQSPSETPGEK